MSKLTGTCTRCGALVESYNGLTWWQETNNRAFPVQNYCPRNLVDDFRVEHFAPSVDRPEPVTADEALNHIRRLHTVFMELVSPALGERPDLLAIYAKIPDAIIEHDKRMPLEQHKPSWFMGISDKVNDIERQPFYLFLRSGIVPRGSMSVTESLLPITEAVAAYLRHHIEDYARGHYQLAADVDHTITWATSEIARRQQA